MASRMIGRAACPECGFSGAHVKQSDKCTYRYCPECGAQHHARTERQQRDLMDKTRLVDAPAVPPKAPAEPTATDSASATATTDPVAEATPTEPSPTGSEATKPKRRGLFT